MFAGPSASVLNEGGQLLLVSKEVIPSAAIQRSSMLQALHETPGSTAELPVSRAAFSAWARSTPIARLWAAPERPWRNIIGNLQVCDQSVALDVPHIQYRGSH